MSTFNIPEYEAGAPVIPEYEVGFPDRNVELETVERLTFHELVEYTVDDFVILQGHNPCLWCNGYLLAFYPVNPEFFDRALNNGVRWYRQMSYAVMPKYKQVIKVAGNVEAQIINYRNSGIGKLIVEFIEKYREHQNAK